MKHFSLENEPRGHTLDASGNRWIGSRAVYVSKEPTMFFAPVVRTRASAPALRSYDRSFERFVNDAFFGSGVAQGFGLTQDDKSWTVTLDLPGVAREDLSI